MLEFLNSLNWTAIIIAANLNQSAKKWRDIEWARNERTQKKAPAAISLILQEGAKVHETGENQ